MILTTLALAVLSSPTAAAPVVAPHDDDLDWFEGSWDGMRQAVLSSDKLAFLDFNADWCGWCKKLAADTFPDEAVGKEMAGILCFSVDLSPDESGAIKDKVAEGLADKYHVNGLPTLLFLQADPATKDLVVRDVIVGYLPPKEFQAEVARIKRDEGTVPALRRAVAANPQDLQARYDLSQKLGSIGDDDGAKEQIDAIHTQDPEGKELVSRRLALDDLLAGMRKTADPAPLYAFLDKETDSELLFEGWRNAWQVEAYRTTKAEDADRAPLLSAWVHAAREAWKRVPEDQIASEGNNIAWGLYSQHESLAPEDLAFAVQVAEAATKAAGDDPNVIDTLACCLHASGQDERAIELVNRCMQLDPSNPQWKQRLQEFGQQQP